MAQPPTESQASQLLLGGRNSVENPEQERPSALQGGISPDAAAPVGGTTEVKLCRSLRELSHTLQGHAGGSLGLGPLPLPLLSYRKEFLESLHTTIFSVSLVVKVRRVLAGLKAPDPSLRAEVAQGLASEGLDRFVAQHGDCWVRSLQLGGEVQGIYTLYAQSREEADQVVRSIGLHLPLEGLTLTPEFGSQLRLIQKESSVNSSLRVQVLGLRQPPSVASADELMAIASGFGSLNLDAPVVLSVETRGYEELPELMTQFAPVVANRELFLGSDSNPGLLRRRQRLLEIGNQCRWVEDTYRIYGQTPEPALADQAAQVQKDVAEIDKLAKAFTQSASTPLQAPELPALRQGSPRLQPKIRDGERLGGEGGQPFEFRDRFLAIQRRRRLWKVGLKTGKLIDRIRLTYIQESAALADEAQPNTWTEEYGGGGGDERGTLELDLNHHECIATLNANTGTGVDQLEFISNEGRSLSGGRPSNGGRASSWNAGPREVLLGFQGRAKTWLDQLQPVIADFHDALRWEPVREEEDP